MASDKAILPLSSQKPRIPKLSYRNSTFGDVGRRDSSSTVSTTHTQSAASSTPTSPRWSSCASPGLPPDPSSSATETFPTSPLTASFPSTGSSTVSSTPPKTCATEARKKGITLGSFFRVKEPSTQAFEEYQKQLRRKAQVSNQRTLVAALPGVSMTKLPPTVPKVNSKWDGIPEAQRDREKKNNPQRHSFYDCKKNFGRLGSQDSRTRTSTASSGRPRSSPGYGGSRTGSAIKLSEIYGWESTSSTNIGSISDLDILTSRTSMQTVGNSEQRNSGTPDMRPTDSMVKPLTATWRKSASDSPSSEGISPIFNSERRCVAAPHASVPGVAFVAKTPMIAPVVISPTSPPRNCVDHSDNHNAKLIPLDNESCSRPASCHVQPALPQSDFVKSKRHSSDASPSRLSDEYSIDEETPSHYHDVVVRSIGEDVLSPPIPVRKKANISVPSATENSETAKPYHTHIPNSIRKKSLAPRGFHYPHRPKFSATKHKGRDNAASDVQDHTRFPSSLKGDVSPSVSDNQEGELGNRVPEVSLDDDLNPGSDRKSGFRNALRRRSRIPLSGA